MEENISAINANEINEELVLNNKEDLPERKRIKYNKLKVKNIKYTKILSLQE